MKNSFLKLIRYEFWPLWLFYLPVFPFWVFWTLRSGSPIYLINVNPTIKWGGLFNYSKSELLQKLPQNFRPKEKVILPENFNQLNALLPFPFIVKPDFGERGKGVELVHNEIEWMSYVQNKNHALILQEYIKSSFEFGLFIVKNPIESKVELLSITAKRFLTFKGDGKTSLRHFIEKDLRANSRKAYLYLKFHDRLDEVLPLGKEILLEEIGNHNRGTEFYDASHLITPKLEKQLEQLIHYLDEFYYGRLDVKSSSEEALKNGEFTVLEINGANSEPTHVYDPNYSLLKAYKEVLRHFKWQYKIAKINKKRGFSYPKTIDFIKDVRQYFVNRS